MSRRALNVTSNYLSGDVPTGLRNQFGSASFDYNCLDNCTYLRQAVCANVSQPEHQALVDLYNSTSGPGWRTQTGWMSGTDPCYANATSTWWGVGCAAVRGQCGWAIRYDPRPGCAYTHPIIVYAEQLSRQTVIQARQDALATPRSRSRVDDLTTRRRRHCRSLCAHTHAHTRTHTHTHCIQAKPLTH